jgi:tripartite-type tricarboxylate transporter receptor subunit TctC
MTIATRRIARGAAAAALLFAALLPAALAQAWPSRPLRIIVPFAPGGVTDMVSRTMAQGLTAELGQPVIVENRAGASGIPGAEAAAKADPDGYTLMMGNISTLAINAAVFEKLPYDPQKSFAPISMVARQPLLVVVNPAVPAKTIDELIKLGKAKPNSLNFGSAGASLRLATEAFNQATGIKMTHVPYKGSGPAMTDLVAGHIEVLFDAFSSLYPFVQDGKVRALAITSAKRSPLAPELPTLTELGLPKVDVTSWQAIVVPAGVPPAVSARLVDAVHKVLAKPAIQAQLAKQGVEPVPSTPQELSTYADAEMKRWKAVAQTAGVKPE